MIKNVYIYISLFYITEKSFAFFWIALVTMKLMQVDIRNIQHNQLFFYNVNILNCTKNKKKRTI
jgi:hypothetical protein